MESTYPAFMGNCKCYDYLKSRATLISTIEIIDQINYYVFGIMLDILNTFY